MHRLVLRAETMRQQDPQRDQLVCRTQPLPVNHQVHRIMLDLLVQTIALIAVVVTEQVIEQVIIVVAVAVVVIAVAAEVVAALVVEVEEVEDKQ